MWHASRVHGMSAAVSSLRVREELLAGLTSQLGCIRPCTRLDSSVDCILTLHRTIIAPGV